MIWLLGVFPSDRDDACRLSACSTEGTHYAALLMRGDVWTIQLCLEHADAFAAWFQCPGKVKGIVDLFLVDADLILEPNRYVPRGRMRPFSSRRLVRTPQTM